MYLLALTYSREHWKGFLKIDCFCGGLIRHNQLASLAIWLSVRLRIKWLWVRGTSKEKLYLELLETLEKKMIQETVLHFKILRYQCPKYLFNDCNGIRTHKHVVLKRTLSVRLRTKWLRVRIQL